MQTSSLPSQSGNDKTKSYTLEKKLINDAKN